MCFLFKTTYYSYHFHKTKLISRADDQIYGDDEMNTVVSIDGFVNSSKNGELGKSIGELMKFIPGSRKKDITRLFFYASLKEEIMKYYDEETAREVSAHATFNDEQIASYQMPDGKFITVDKIARTIIIDDDEPDEYWKVVSDGFEKYQDDMILGFDMNPLYIEISSYSAGVGYGDFDYSTSVRFEYLTDKENRPVLSYLGEKGITLFGEVVLYKDGGHWKYGRVEDVKEFTVGNAVITGVPIINGEPFIGMIIPARFLGLPSKDSETFISALKMSYRSLKAEFDSIENLNAIIQSTTELGNFSVGSSIEAGVDYSAKKLLFEISMDVLNVTDFVL